MQKNRNQMLQFQVTPNVMFIFPKTPRCKCNKTTHTQLLGALLKNSGLASEGDIGKTRLVHHRKYF